MKTAERRTKGPRRAAKPNRGMAIRIAGRVDIPEWVRDHESFRRWARSPECPEHLRVAFINGDLWVDADMEQLYVHNQVKVKVAVTLTALAESAQAGRFIADGMLLSIPDVGLSTVPDGCFVTYESLRLGRVREVAGRTGGCVELEGAPEMVLEVVSDSSETKDLIDLPALYWQAGVAEYWTIDVRTDEPLFQLWKRGPSGYVLPRKLAGRWRKSDVFGRSFRLTQGSDPLGKPLFTLEVK